MAKIPRLLVYCLSTTQVTAISTLSIPSSCKIFVYVKACSCVHLMIVHCCIIRTHTYTHTRSYTHNNILYVISLHEYISLSVSLLSKSALVPLSFSVREKGFSSMVHHGSYPHSPVHNINLTSKTQGFHDRRDGEGLCKAVANETR